MIQPSPSRVAARYAASPPTLRQVKALLKRTRIEGELSGRGRDWSVELPDRRTSDAFQKAYQKAFGAGVGGYRTGYGAWVMRPGYGADPHDFNNPASRHHYAALPEEPVVGDILYSNWGYDQTNIDYYQIIKATPKQVVIRQLLKKVVGKTRASEKVVPLKGKFDSRGKTLRRKWRPGWNGGIAVSINSYSGAYSWDGRPQSQTLSGLGH